MIYVVVAYSLVMLVEDTIFNTFLNVIYKCSGAFLKDFAR